MSLLCQQLPIREVELILEGEYITKIYIGIKSFDGLVIDIARPSTNMILVYGHNLVILIIKIIYVPQEWKLPMNADIDFFFH